MIGYILERRSAWLEWIRVNDSPIPRLTYTVHNLTPCTEYQFRVAAVNWRGTGSFSNPSDVITTKAVTVPGQPPSLNIVRRSGTSVTLQWTTPEDNGEEIIGYVVHYGVPGTDRAKYSQTHITGQVSECTLTGELEPATKYHFAVSAINRLGRGPSSKFSQPVVTGKRSGK